MFSRVHRRFILAYIDKNIPTNTPIVIETIVKKNKGISILLSIGHIPIEILSELAIEKNITRRKNIININFDKIFVNIKYT